MMQPRWLVAVGVLAATVSVASAAFVDTPIPTLDGAKARLVFSVPGVTANSGGLETVFVCTSLEATKPMVLGVQIFDFDGTLFNDVDTGNGVLDVDPGTTVTIETNTVAAFDDDTNVTSNGPAAVSHGAARILATSTKLMCTALLVSASGTPPATMTNLQVIRRSQKGD